MAGLTPIVGRETELRDLRAAFESHNVQVLSGMGGVGKTSLARAYAQRHLNDYGVAWWVRAEDPSATDAEFRALLDALLPAGQAAQIDDVRTTAFIQLARQTDPWLLVLDNVPDPAAAHGLLPPAGNGHVLITSRAQGWPHAIRIEPLEMNAAVQLLTTRSGDGNEGAAKSLAAELGHLPLALTQAAGFSRANAISLATYLRFYRDRSSELHTEGQPPDYLHTVATTWQLAMDRLTEKARELLNLIAFYAPDAIPVHLLFSSWDEFTRHRAIGELLSYGLITPAGEGTVTVHRLVQAVTRNRLDDSPECADRARNLIRAAMPEFPPTAITLANWKALHTHVLALVDHLPPEHVATLVIRHEMALWTGEAGDAARARDLFAELLPIQERVQGAEHPDTLNTRHEMARWTGEAGDAARARDLFAELLPIQERVRGPEHSATLTTRHEMARCTGEAGDAVRARDLFAELLPILERASGAEHPYTLSAKHEQLRWTGTAGDAVRARDLSVELVSIKERVLPAEHPSTLMTMHNLARWTGDAGDAARARDLFAELLPIRARVLGAEHSHTLDTWHSLAYWTGRAGDWVRARDLFAELLPIRKRVTGAEHPYTLITLRNLAYWAELAGAVEEEGPGGGAGQNDS